MPQWENYIFISQTHACTNPWHTLFWISHDVKLKKINDCSSLTTITWSQLTSIWYLLSQRPGFSLTTITARNIGSIVIFFPNVYCWFFLYIHKIWHLQHIYHQSMYTAPNANQNNIGLVLQRLLNGDCNHPYSLIMYALHKAKNYQWFCHPIYRADFFIFLYRFERRRHGPQCFVHAINPKQLFQI